MFGLGCFYLGGLSEAAAVSVVGRALDLGCTYVDTAPSYFAGVSESHVGKGLGRRRDTVFLSTKTLERTAGGAQRELEASLKRLRTEVIDLVQVHCVRDEADLQAVLAPRGPLTALRAARDKGQIRFIGVTGHEDPELMKKAVGAADWASVLMPLNPVDAHWKSFLESTLPEAKRLGLARVAMKVFASGRLVQGPGALSPEDCLRFAFGLDVSCAIVGCASIAEVELAARVAAEAKPLDADEAEGARRRREAVQRQDRHRRRVVQAGLTPRGVLRPSPHATRSRDPESLRRTASRALAVGAVPDGRLRAGVLRVGVGGVGRGVVRGGLVGVACVVAGGVVAGGGRPARRGSAAATRRASSASRGGSAGMRHSRPLPIRSARPSSSSALRTVNQFSGLEELHQRPLHQAVASAA